MIDSWQLHLGPTSDNPYREQKWSIPCRKMLLFVHYVLNNEWKSKDKNVFNNYYWRKYNKAGRQRLQRETMSIVDVSKSQTCKNYKLQIFCKDCNIYSVQGTNKWNRTAKESKMLMVIGVNFSQVKKRCWFEISAFSSPALLATGNSNCGKFHVSFSLLSVAVTKATLCCTMAFCVVVINYCH